MTEAVPTFDDVLRQALAGVRNDDVAVFLAYFEELKQYARRQLRGNAAMLPGASAVVQSALLSLLGDVSVQQVPLADVDEFGYPMLWPLLLRYIERHCDKWNKFYLAKKRRGTVVSLTTAQSAALDPPDPRWAEPNESALTGALEALLARLDADDRRLLEGRLEGRTLAELEKEFGRSQSTLSYRLKRIRTLLESA